MSQIATKRRAPRRAAARRRQRGSALVMLVLAVFALLIAALSAPLELALTRGQAEFASARQAALSAARERILAWYAARLAQLDAEPDFALPEAEVLAQAGVSPRWGLRLAAGPLVSDGALRFRTLALWIPAAAGDRSAFGRDGSFHADPALRHVLLLSTRTLHQQALSDSERILQALARDAERRFAAKQQADPDHRMDRNWFRSPDGRCRRLVDQLPCSGDIGAGGWAPVASLHADTLAFGAAVGDETTMPNDVNAWGLPNFWSNDVDPATVAAPPFSMAFSTLTPWGARLEVRAVQPW